MRRVHRQVRWTDVAQPERLPEARKRQRRRELVRKPQLCAGQPALHGGAMHALGVGIQRVGGR